LKYEHDLPDRALGPWLLAVPPESTQCDSLTREPGLHYILAPRAGGRLQTVSLRKRGGT
jgi:hypothetical protein